MSRDVTARLRKTYTGEPYAAAYEWYRTSGLFNGLVPDADDPLQQRLEAAVLRSLVRPHPAGLPQLVTPGTFFGLEGVSPDPDALLLRPAADLVAEVLARVLPVRTADGVAGVAGLRTYVNRHSGRLTISRLGDRAEIAVLPSQLNSVKGARKDLRKAHDLVVAAGLEPLWDAGSFQAGEPEAWQQTAGDAAADPLWSRALRRMGLFLQSPPDWSRRAPSEAELEGPKPERIKPRPVGPAGPGRFRGVVAVTSASGRGGMGCTTTALALSTALARSGSKVGLLAGSDPNSPHGLTGGPAPAPGVWYELVDVPSGGTLQAAVLPQDAGPVIAAARAECDVVVIDAGNAFQHRSATAFADVALVLAGDDERYWTISETTDRRPEKIQFFAWLYRQRAQFASQTLGPGDPVEQMLYFLDAEFGYYVEELEEQEEDDDELLVYDDQDPHQVEDWWHTYELASLYDDEDDLVNRLPKEDEAPGLDALRERFIAFLTSEGQRRHGEVWERAARQWAARNKARNLKNFAPAQELIAFRQRPLETFLNEIEDEAVSRFGAQLWDEQCPVWAAACEDGDDLMSPWDHLVETVSRPRPVTETADHLQGQLRDLPDIRTIVALSRARRHPGQHHVAAVRDELTDRGFESLLAIPDLKDFSNLQADAAALSALSGGAAAGAANRLALAVANALRAEQDGTRP
ncbi:hypothetical protein [Streptomyces luteireticuli]|uniref:hypothetical protein n=1 Tax=Streptomyces luteireticuli TaxID=173858 RepID=UPI003555FA08